MTSSVEQNSGIGRSATLLLVLVSVICVSLIGGAGYIKFQIDRATYALTTASDTTTSVSTNLGNQAQQEQRSLDVARKRQIAERHLRDWSLALTFLSWVSLIFTATMIIAIYLTLQRRQSPALRALGQSIANLARGDMQTPIWGTERHDAIGDLARSVDLARYHFSQLPDMSLLSDQGPVRIKFEGGARTLFEAMMQQISTQVTRINEEAQDISAAASSQHKILADLPKRLNFALESLQKLDQTNTQAVNKVTQNLSSACGQLEKIIPFMQSRAQNMAEVTQIAGTQVASTLRNLIESEQNLRASTTSSAKAVADLTISAKDLNDRISTALNVLQTSGKALTETTESSQVRLKSLFETLGEGETKLSAIVDRVEQRLEATAKAETSLLALTERSEKSSLQMDGVIKSMVEHQDKLNGQISEATQRLDTIIGSFSGAEQAMSSALQNIQANGEQLNNVFTELKTNNEQVLGKLSRTSETSHEVVQHLSDCTQKMMDQLKDQMATQMNAAQEQITIIAKHNEELSDKAISATECLNRSANEMGNAQHNLESVQERFADMIHEMSGSLEKQVSASFSRTEEFSKQNLEKLSTLTGSVDQALQRLSVLSQLTNTLGTVAGQLGTLIPSLGGCAPAQVVETPATANVDIEALSSKLADELSSHFDALVSQVKPKNPAVIDASQIDVSGLSEKLFVEFEEKWKNSVDQIDSVRDDLAALMEQQKGHLELRLSLLDKQIKALAAQKPDFSQLATLQEIVSTLDTINAHLAQTGLSAGDLGDNADHTSFLGGKFSS